MPAAAGGLFIDTSAWLAVNEPREKLHETAKTFFKEEALKDYRPLITSNLVLAETHAGLLRARGRSVALKFIALIEASSRIQIVHSTREMEEQAFRLLIKYQDQDFSLCDAVSFSIMKDRDVRAAFAFDQHFETAGFNRLPREAPGRS